MMKIPVLMNVETMVHHLLFHQHHLLEEVVIHLVHLSLILINIILFIQADICLAQDDIHLAQLKLILVEHKLYHRLLVLLIICYEVDFIKFDMINPHQVKRSYSVNFN